MIHAYIIIVLEPSRQYIIQNASRLLEGFTNIYKDDQSKHNMNKLHL